MTKQRHPDAWQREDYKGSHVKGKIFYGGVHFIMVKERMDGKPHPRFFALLTADYEPVGVGSQNSKRGDPGPQTTDDWEALLRQCFPDTDEGRKLLRDEIERIVR